MSSHGSSGLPPVIIAAAIVAAGAIAAASTAKNTYQIATEGSAVFRLDTRTGEVRACVPFRDQNIYVMGGAATTCHAPLR